MFCRKCLEPKWMYAQVPPPGGLSIVLMSSVSLFQKLVVQSGARLGIWRLLQPRWTMAIVYSQKYTVVCAERQDISGLQMADAEFCICKLLCWHVILLKCCLGAEYSYCFIGAAFWYMGKIEGELGWSLSPCCNPTHQSPCLFFIEFFCHVAWQHFWEASGTWHREALNPKVGPLWLQQQWRGFTASQFGEKVLLGCVTGVCMGLLFTGVRNQNLSVFTFF